MTKYLIAIDPGVHAFAYAYFIDGVLSECNMISMQEARSIKSLKIPFIEFLLKKDKQVIIEKPQIYSTKYSYRKGADPNDLIDLAISIGQLTLFFETFDCIVKHILPRQWKGNAPKKVMNDHVLTLLPEREKRILVRCPVIKSKKHNVLDAIGIGLQTLGRLR